MKKRWMGRGLAAGIGLALMGTTAWAADSAAVALRDAQSALRRRKLDAAEAKVAPILQANPGHPEALRVRAQILKARGDTVAAIRTWEKAYQSIGGLPEKSDDDLRLLRRLRADLNSNDKGGQKLRTVDGTNLRKLTNFIKEMRKREVEDLYARVKSLVMRIDPGHQVVLQYLKDEIAARKRQEQRRRSREARARYQAGLPIGGSGIGEPAGGSGGGAGRSHYASDGAFDMHFSNQAMMRWLTQMFWMPGQNVPLVENGYLFFANESTMIHHAAKLSEGRQLRLIAKPGAGVVGLGVRGKRALLRVEGGQATGPDGVARPVLPAPEGTDEIILQHVDGRYQGFANGRLVFTGVSKLGDERFAVTLSSESRVYSLHLEPAETILATAASEEALDAELAEAQRQQAIADRKRAAELLVEGKGLYGQSRYEEALGALSEAGALDPLALEALYLVAKCREKTGRRRPACQALRAYLQIVALVKRGELKPPEGTPAVAVDAAREADARKVVAKLDWEGRRLDKIMTGYLAELDRLRNKLQGDAYTVERIHKRQAQLRKFVVIP